MAQRIFTPFFSLLLFLLSFPWAARAQQPEAVSLTFGWPDGFTAYVEQEWTKISQTPGRADTGYVVSTYRMRGLKHDEGLLIRKDSFDLPGYAGKKPLSPLAELMQQARAFFPDYVVNRRGEFLHLENFARTKTVFDSVFGPQIARLDPSPQLRAVFDTMMSETQMQGVHVEEWNELVGFWSGATLETGVPYEESFEQPTPLVPGLTLPMKRTAIITRRVHCNPQAEKSACIELQVTVEIDSAGMLNYMRGVAEKFSGAETEGFLAALRNMEFVQTTTLTADPETMTPYRLTKVKRVQGLGQDPQTGRAAEFFQEESRIFRFRYEAVKE